MSGHPEPWRDLPAAQQPQWADPAALPAVLADLRAQPPLTLPSECDRLRTRLAEAARGQAFVLQGGDCAETFAGVSAEVIRGKLDTLAQMAVILTYATSIPVVTVGRIAGQYAKPRSKPTETRGSLTLPAYRGDAVNGPEFTGEARRPDPARLRLAYQASATTLNFLRGVTADADVDRWLAHSWRRDLVRHPPLGSRHDRLAREIDAALRFVRAWRLDAAHSAEFYTSHEALILDYESALVRQDPRSGEWYDSSGHMLWIGERTRQPDGAHIEFASTIRNAVGVKLGPTATPGLVRTLVDKLDPERRPGRLTFITRMGQRRIRDVLPELVTAVTASEADVVWLCDPMHGNTVPTFGGHKTRYFDDMVDEIAGFFEVHRGLGTHPGGIHLELTGEDVTECVGGAAGVRPEHLPQRYETACDPRLNRAQSLEFAFLVAELYRGQLAGRAAGRELPAAVATA